MNHNMALLIFPSPLLSGFEIFDVWQAVELKASEILHLGPCDNSAGNYPIAKKKQTLEALREKAHLRPRTNTIGAVARIRNALAFATHEFFQSSGFLYVHTPIITTSDCEGAGEMFQVCSSLCTGMKCSKVMKALRSSNFLPLHSSSIKVSIHEK